MLMNYLVQSLIDTSCSEEFKRSFEDVQTIVENFELEGLEDALTAIAMEAENYESVDIPAAIYAKTVEYMLYLLQNHEIKLIDNAALEDIVKIANTVWLVQDWIDHDSIVRITESDGSPEEKFSDIVALVEVAESISILNVLDSVSDAFIESLQELHQTTFDTPTEQSLPDDYVEQLRKFKRFYSEVKAIDTNKIFAFQVIAHGMQLGGSFSFYYNLIKKKFDSEDVDFLSTQYLALFYLGYDSYTNVLNFWRENNDQWLDDPSVVTKVDIALNQLNNEFMSWKDNTKRVFKEL